MEVCGKWDPKFDYRVLVKALKVTENERMVFQVWDTPSDITGKDFKNIIRSKINTTGLSKAQILLLCYHAENPAQFDAVTDVEFLEENILPLLDDDTENRVRISLIFLIANTPTGKKCQLDEEQRQRKAELPKYWI